MDASLPAFQQYMLELANARRLEAGAQPLAWSPELGQASSVYVRRISETGRFAHVDDLGQTPSQRMRVAGFRFRGYWVAGENLAWKSASAPDGLSADVGKLDVALFNSPSHRRNILDPRYRLGGVGLARGALKDEPAVIAAMNFALSGEGVWLTGVAAFDRDGDDGYDPGEGLEGLEIVATSDTGEERRAQTRPGGGYDLEVVPGVWSIEARAPDGRRAFATVAVRRENVKADVLMGDGESWTRCSAEMRVVVRSEKARFQVATAEDRPRNAPVTAVRSIGW